MSRAYCNDCTRPVSECYCDAVIAIDNPIKVIILQHPKETEHPYNTARIAKLALNNCDIHVAETLTEQLLQSLVASNACLLFPNHAVLEKSSEPSKPPSAIVVIDASWKKAQKMLHLNPQLQQLPRIALIDISPSEYKIRRTNLPDALSTIESIKHGLALFDTSNSYQDLLTPFHTMIRLAKRYIPDEHL